MAFSAIGDLCWGRGGVMLMKRLLYRGAHPPGAQDAALVVLSIWLLPVALDQLCTRKKVRWVSAAVELRHGRQAASKLCRLLAHTC